MDTTVQKAVELRGITKVFGDTIANHDVNMDLYDGEILALLGENGSGKTTLMNMLSGIYFPDSGSILIHGKEVTIRSPRDSFALGIGMIHQHFKLVDVLTAAENIVLGLPGSVSLNRRALNEEIKKISLKYGFVIDPEKKIYNMSVSEKQTVEIVKVLYRGADILILDEPTAVLTPQETERLFAVLRAMKQDGKAIIIITHKLNEVLSVSDRVAILRKGEHIATLQTSEATVQTLTEMMVGRSVSLSIERPEGVPRKKCLKVDSLTCVDEDGLTVLNNVSFRALGGEILGVAGVAGSGQKELCEALAGLYPVKGGAILFHNDVDGHLVDENLVGKTPDEILRKGVTMSFVPEDRLGMGLVASMGMVGNVMLKSYKKTPGILIDSKTPRKVSEKLIRDIDIDTPGISTPIRQLSGGNVQKVLVGREIECNPQLLIVAYPVRGLDINSSYLIYKLLNEQKKKGVAVIFVGEDLDVLMELSDRIMVLCAGQVSGIVDPRVTTKEEIGLLMTQVNENREEADT